MLDLAVLFLKDELSNFFLTRTGTDSVEVKLSKVVEESGKYAFDEGAIGLSVINIEEDRIFKTQLPEYTYQNGQQAALEPELKINLSLLFAANFKLYDQALKFLSLVLQFFQSHPTFTSDEFPALDPRIGKLNVELQSLTYEQLNQIWAYIGGKHLPSIIYRVRLVVIQDQVQTTIHPPITTIHSDVHDR